MLTKKKPVRAAKPTGPPKFVFDPTDLNVELYNDQFPYCCAFTVIGELDCFRQDVEDQLEEQFKDYLGDLRYQSAPGLTPKQLAVALLKACDAIDGLIIATTSSENSQLVREAMPLAGFVPMLHKQNSNSNRMVTMWLKG